MQQISGKAAPVFQEIPGESISERRIRYWRWKRGVASARATYTKKIKDGRQISLGEMNILVRELTRQVEAMQKELAKHGYTFKVGD